MTHSKKLFLFGLGIHAIYLIVILNTNSILSEFWQKDNGQLTERFTNYYIDSKSYIESADNYSQYGVFGKEDNPDYHRTIGYPMIIYLFKVLLGQNWYYGLVLFQLLLGALVYPIVYRIGLMIFPGHERNIYSSVIALIILGGYFTKTFFVMTDLTFAFFFLLGIYFSITSVVRKDTFLFILLGMISFFFCSLVRPNLLLYPVAHLLLLLYVSKQYGTWKKHVIKSIIFGSTVLLTFICNYSSFRVNYHYGTFSSTDVLGINMFQYTVKEVLEKADETDRYHTLENEIKNEKDWLRRDKLRKKYFFETVSRFPLISVLYWCRAAQAHLLIPHYMEIGSAYGYYKRDVVDKNLKLRKSTAMVLVFYTFFLINLVVSILFFLYLFDSIFKKRDYLFVLMILSVIFLIIGPSFIADTSPRMRIPVEPFILFLAFEYVHDKKQLITDKLKFHKMTFMKKEKNLNKGVQVQPE